MPAARAPAAGHHVATRDSGAIGGRDMDVLLWRLLRYMRPRVGWPRWVLGLLAALCMPLAAAESDLNLPAGLFFWAALLGFGLGLWLTPRRRPVRLLVRIAHAILLGCVAGAGAIIVVLLAAHALPPGALMLQDLMTSSERSLGFLSQSLPRFWHDLTAAPYAGQAGGQLLAIVGGLALTWLGSLTLGRTLLAGQ